VGDIVEMTDTIPKDPAQEYEHHFVSEQVQHQQAKEYEARGWTALAKIAHKKAAGHKSARTRIARKQGWI
jgi:hypothetical protein